MKGVVCSTRSVLALYKELKEEEGHQHYLCTYQLNQDPLEVVPTSPMLIMMDSWRRVRRRSWSLSCLGGQTMMLSNTSQDI